MRALLCCLAFASALGNTIVDLKHNTFDDFVANKEKPTFIKFFAPWCTHCQHLAPIYDETAVSIGDQIAMTRVDCTDSYDTAVCSRFGVKGFPTLMMVRWVDDPALLAQVDVTSSEEPAPKTDEEKAAREAKEKDEKEKLMVPGLRVFKFTGPRTKEDMTAWIEGGWKNTKPVRFPGKTETLAEKDEDVWAFIRNHPYLAGLYLFSIIAVIAGFGYILCDAYRSGPDEDPDQDTALVPTSTATTTTPKPPSPPVAEKTNGASSDGGKAGQGLTQRKPSKPENT